MIGVGINENVVITKSVMNDKKRLVIGLNYAGENVAKGPRNYFDESLTAGVESDSNGLELQILGPLVSKKDEHTKEKKLDMLSDDFKKLKNQLTAMLLQFMPLDKIDIMSADIQYAGTGITAQTFADLALDQDKVNRRYENICARFITLISPFLNNAEYALRFKLLRQSKDKHYATIPSRYVQDQPFVELMSVPKETSAVKFSDWEKQQGLDSAAPVSTAAAEDKTTSSPAPVASSPFATTTPFAPQQ